MTKPNPHCQVKPSTPDEFSFVINYFLNSTPEATQEMGMDASKLPVYKEWYDFMQSEYNKPIEEKTYFCLTWFYDDKPIGHSCIDNIHFGKDAFTHLHIWLPEFRHKKLGRSFLNLSLQYYFKHFKLEKIYGQPKADNKGPNQLLKHMGFKLVKHYKTIPHPICVEQFVNLYVLDQSNFK
jgi:RimJ/RimL family protein N-acetyltransferase